MLGKIDAVDFQRAWIFEAGGTTVGFQIVREYVQQRIFHALSLAYCCLLV